MATADKLTTVAENVPKVYYAGQLNIVKNAECLKNNKSGSAILIDDVSPVTHEMGVKIESKNLIPYPYLNSSQTIRGVTFTANSDGTITANGMSISSNVYFEITSNSTFYIPEGNYILSGCPSGGSSTTYSLAALNGSAVSHTKFIEDFGNGITLSSSGEYWIIRCQVMSGWNVKNLIFKPQIELGTTATEYTPYVPDLTAVKVKRCGKNLLDINQAVNSSGNNAYDTFSINDNVIIATSDNSTTKIVTMGLFDGGLPAGDYILSLNAVIENTPKHPTKNNAIYIFKNGSFLTLNDSMPTDGSYSTTLKFTLSEKAKIKILFYKSVNAYAETVSDTVYKVTLSNIQLKLGSTATDYEPYITPTEYTPTADGVVNGVTSLYPNTTLMTDTDGVIIDCNYYKDIDKTFNELTTSVALSGGDS